MQQRGLLNRACRWRYNDYCIVAFSLFAGATVAWAANPVRIPLVATKNPLATSRVGNIAGGANVRRGMAALASSSAALTAVNASDTVLTTKFDVDDTSGGELNFWLSLFIGSLLFLLILCCVVGNFLVILAILLERDLRSRPQYYLIFSLAVADIIVGLVVTPLGAWSTVKQAWNLGVTLCDLWISVDVLVCTASILHLVAIALDRYWSVTDIYYTQNRTPKRIFYMIIIIWVVSLVISVGPMLGWKDEFFVTRVREQHVCLISQEISYQVFSTATAFYIPLCAIIFIYYKIMRAAKKRFKRERERKTISHFRDESSLRARLEKRFSRSLQPPPQPTTIVTPAAAAVAMLRPPTPVLGPTTDDEDEGGPDGSEVDPTVITGLMPGLTENGHFGHAGLSPSTGGQPVVAVKYECATPTNISTSEGDEEKTPLPISENPTTAVSMETQFIASKATTNGGKESNPPVLPVVATRRLSAKTNPAAKKKKRKVKESAETKRERKAWRTLAIITGTFVACWTPFFLISLYRPICGCRIPPVLESVTAWLGYLNSALNPIIYTVFSMDFRMAFQRIIKRLCLVKDF